MPALFFSGMITQLDGLFFTTPRVRTLATEVGFPCAFGGRPPGQAGAVMYYTRERSRLTCEKRYLHHSHTRGEYFGGTGTLLKGNCP